MPPSHMNKLRAQGVCEIRSFNLSSFSLKYRRFRDREGETVNEYNSDNTTYLYKFYAVKMGSEFTNIS
jgi:hypothetical protein